jgi:hypothetical protein
LAGQQTDSTDIQTPATDVQPLPGVTSIPPQWAMSAALPAWSLRDTRRRNRITAAVILGVMLLMAATGLTFALLTQKDRRANDAGITNRPNRNPVPVKPDEDARPTPTPPSQLAALGYLPPDTNVVIGIHLTELRQDPAGRQILDHPIQVGPYELSAANLASWTGLPRDDIDHLVLGITTDVPVLPRLNLVVRTRRPYDIDKVRAAIRGVPVRDGKKKDLYQFELRNLKTPPPVLWCVDPRTLVIGLLPSHLETVPTTPRSGLEHLPADVREVLTERVDPAAPPFWIVGHVDDALQRYAKGLFARVKPEDYERLMSIRTFAAWVQMEKQVVTQAVFRCGEPAAARGLEQWFVGPDPAVNGAVKAACEDVWLTLQYKTDVESVLHFLGR